MEIRNFSISNFYVEKKTIADSSVSAFKSKISYKRDRERQKGRDRKIGTEREGQKERDRKRGQKVRDRQ